MGPQKFENVYVKKLSSEEKFTFVAGSVVPIIIFLNSKVKSN